MAALTVTVALDNGQSVTFTSDEADIKFEMPTDISEVDGERVLGRAHFNLTADFVDGHVPTWTNA